MVGTKYFLDITPDQVASIIAELESDAAPGIGGRVMPSEIGTRLVTARFGNEDARTLAGYEKTGGYQTLRKALAMRPERHRQRGQGVEPARPRRRGLRDRREVDASSPRTPRRSTSSCNADESEPGTCKDRELIYWDPHLLIEGMIIAAHALKAVHNYIYIRGEMMREYAVLAKAPSTRPTRAATSARTSSAPASRCT